MLALGRGVAADADSLLAVRQANFDRFAEANPEERVYLHFDNTSYYKGERIWYKAYVVRGSDFIATPLSRILYVELLNPMGYPVETQKLAINNGQADGSFLLADTLNAGFYEVRAYTAWMLNFTPGDRHGWQLLGRSDARFHYGERFQRYLNGNAGLFSRVFPIYEAVDSGRYWDRRMPRLPKATSALADPVADRLLIDFYPEGGNFVSGVPTRIAFQARNSEGRTLNVAGTLVRGGEPIGMFKTDYAGRGVFSATADDYDDEELVRGLKLQLTYRGRDYSFSLPRARRRGYALAVFPSPGGLRVGVARNARTEGMELGLSVTCRGLTGYAGVVDLRDSLSQTLAIDTALLRTGVNIVTLYTAEGKVLAQRMAFVNKHDTRAYSIDISGIADTSDLRPYERVSLTCQALSPGGKPIADSLTFSLAVTDAGSREMTYDTGNALTYLLLSSEIKGFVPHPAYYFEADDAEHRAALDLLLMVQGWTRYDFERMMAGDTLRPMPEAERGIVFRGRVLNARNDINHSLWRPVASMPWLYSELALSPDSIFTGECRAGADGEFTLFFPPFYGSGRLSLMFNKDSVAASEGKGDVAGHMYSKRRNRRPMYLLGHHIEPLNAWSPLPKDYGYYETAALNDPWDEGVFGKAFMAAPANPGNYVSYDERSKSHVVADIVKVARRKWNHFREVSPVCVADIDDVMTWLSNIFGDIDSFHWNQRFELGGIEYGGGGGRRDFFDDPYYAGLYELLYIFGIDGTNRSYINADTTGVRYRRAHGSAKLLPKGYKFFPHDENFRLLRIYADIDNRRLIYRSGRYGERVFPYRGVGFSLNGDGMVGGNAHPLTSIFNYVTDDRYPDSSPLPEFMGYRINFQGINRPVEFYQPDYSRMPLPEQTDYRRTVYWTPNVTTGADGRATVTFYNNGFSRRLAVSAEGMTFEVKN